MVHVFIQIFFMQRVMRMNFVRTITMLEQEQLQLMYLHAVCDMYSKSSAFISALVKFVQLNISSFTSLDAGQLIAFKICVSSVWPNSKHRYPISSILTFPPCASFYLHVRYNCSEQSPSKRLVIHCDKVFSSPSQLMLPEKFASL